MSTQRQKAKKLLELHHEKELLILPNIWDVLGAKLLESEGYPAIATASASVAFSHGYDDNQEIPYDRVLQLFKSICDSTSLPVTTDIERGYANSLEELNDNISRLIDCGVVGINIEDTLAKGQSLEPIDYQCEKIRTIREVADEKGVHLVINARTDVYLMKQFDGDRLTEALSRGQQFQDAGADCFYPLLCGNDDLKSLVSELTIPINVLAQKDIPSVSELEAMGIARLSFGPGLLRTVFTQMRDSLRSIQTDLDFSTFFNDDLVPSGEVVEVIKGY